MPRGVDVAFSNNSKFQSFKLHSSFSFFSTSSLFNFIFVVMVNHQTFIRPPTRVFQETTVHPSECRSFAYSQETRSQAIFNQIIGADGPENLNIQNLRQNRLYPSECLLTDGCAAPSKHQFNHIRPFLRTGNHRSRREIKNEKLILLAWHRAALPKATIAEVNAFIFAMNLNDPNNHFHSY